jgi:hypothetical protein
MSPIRMVRDFRDLYRSLSEMLVFEDPVEEAGYELAVSARNFSRNTQAVVDDKLNFSATLMRAGEVSAANRLLEEFERDVREEEAALIERVNEVKMAEAVRRDGLTRVRLARMLTVALIGSSLLSFSAAGMALAGLLKDRASNESADTVRVRLADRQDGDTDASQGRAQKHGSLRHVRIGDVKLLLTASQLRTIRELGGTIDASELQGIIELLPQPLADKVQQAIVVAAETVDEARETVAATDESELKMKFKRKARQAEKAAEAQSEEEATPAPEPSEEPTEEPSPEETSPEDEEKRAEDDGGRGAEGDDDGGIHIPGGDDWGTGGR